MRIALLNITSGWMSGGYEKYLENIIPRLIKHPKVTSVLVGMPETIDFSNWQNDNPSIRWMPLGATMGLWKEVDGRAGKKIDRFVPDVLFIPTARFWSTKGIPVVVMVQNMAPFIESYRNYPLKEKIRNWMRARKASKAIRKSNRIIAVSRFVRDFLIDHLDVENSKIGVVYHGSSLDIDNQSPQKPPNIPDNWQKRFIFTAGLIYPYRGLEDIILALHHLNNSRIPLPMVVAGKIGQGMTRYYNDLKRLVEGRRLQSQIHWAGKLNEAEMIWCYRNCSLLVMTSRVESFGIIGLEGMAHGCICIAADNPCFPEIFGNAALFYPPGKPDILAQRIHEVLSWPDHQCQEIKNGAIARASQFTWELCCERTVCELQKAIDQKNVNGFHRIEDDV